MFFYFSSGSKPFVCYSSQYSLLCNLGGMLEWIKFDIGPLVQEGLYLKICYLFLALVVILFGGGESFMQYSKRSFSELFVWNYLHFRSVFQKMSYLFVFSSSIFRPQNLFHWAKQIYLCKFGRGFNWRHFCGIHLNLDHWFKRKK